MVKASFCFNKPLEKAFCHQFSPFDIKGRLCSALWMIWTQDGMEIVWGSLVAKAWSRAGQRMLGYGVASAASEPLGFWQEQASDYI